MSVCSTGGSSAASKSEKVDDEVKQKERSETNHEDSPQSNSGVRVVQEIFQDYNSVGYKQAKRELEEALKSKCLHIIIEPKQVGEETVRAIKIGNFCHKTTVVAGFATALLSQLAPKKLLLYSIGATMTATTFALYEICWRPDPCSKYQIERDQSTLGQLDYSALSNHTVVVLRHRDDVYRRVLHTTCALLGVGLAVYRFYRQ